MQGSIACEISKAVTSLVSERKSLGRLQAYIKQDLVQTRKSRLLLLLFFKMTCSNNDLVC